MIVNKNTDRFIRDNGEHYIHAKKPSCKKVAALKSLGKKFVKSKVAAKKMVINIALRF